MTAEQVKIEDVETILVDVPTIRPHRLSVATINCQTLVLVRIRCSDGIVGLGEGTTIGGLAYGEESPESIKVNIDTYFAPLLKGQPATRPGAAMRQLRSHYQGNRFAKCAIETALFDAQAQRLGVPLSELFGGRLTDSVQVAWTLASGDTQRDIEEARQMLETRRHRVFKLKIGRLPVTDDVAHVLAI
ncbi:MAG: muconate cycloisomerase, partial [Caballeronia sp.]